MRFDSRVTAGGGDRGIVFEVERIRFRILCNAPLESCQVRKEAALRGSGRVPQALRNLSLTDSTKGSLVDV